MKDIVINGKGELKPVPLVLVFSGFYILFIFVLSIYYPDLLIPFAILIPLLPVLLFVLINKLDYALLIYVAISPIIQHYSIYTIALGDFRISPDIIIHLFLLVASINHFLYSYNTYTKRGLSLLDKTLLVFVLLSIFSLIAASYFPINHSKRILLYYTGIFQPITFYFIILYFLSRVPNFSKKLILAVTLTATFAAIVAFIELKEIGLGLVNLFLARNKIGFGYHNTNLFGMHAALIFIFML